MNIQSDCMYCHTKGDITLLRFSELQKYSDIINHAVSTRGGGVSTIPGLESLNLGTHTADSIENVRENYRRFCDAARFRPETLVLGKQTHSANVRVVTPDDCGKGVFTDRDYTDVDSLVTSHKHIPLVIHTADCVPVMFADTKGRAIGNAHCGWRGTYSKLASVTLDALKENYGVKPEDLVCTIGPCICRNCYEVSRDLYEDFLEKFGKSDALVKNDGQYYIDLPRLNKQILVAEGVAEDRIIVSDICTCCNTEFMFSHRGQGPQRGILASVIELI